MDDSAKARRAARLASSDWDFGIAESHEALAAQELEWWASLPPATRLKACFEVSREAWSVKEARFEVSGPAFGVRPLGTE